MDNPSAVTEMTSVMMDIESICIASFTIGYDGSMMDSKGRESLPLTKHLPLTLACARRGVFYFFLAMMDSMAVVRLMIDAIRVRIYGNLSIIFTSHLYYTKYVI
jgi:hypothetical protein